MTENWSVLLGRSELVQYPAIPVACNDERRAWHDQKATACISHIHGLNRCCGVDGVSVGYAASQVVCETTITIQLLEVERMPTRAAFYVKREDIS